VQAQGRNRVSCLLKTGWAHVFIRLFGFKMIEIECFEQLEAVCRDLTGNFTVMPSA
jgi:hypothetical protein